MSQKKDMFENIIELLGATYARRSMFEKRDNFFQLISTLFCEVKIGFVHRPLKNCSFEVNYIV
jgi:hypothetical protein